MMKNTIQLAILCYAIFFSQAHAEFIEIDWKLEGDSAATLDTSTNIEWLTLLETDGMSLSEVRAELSLGDEGRFEGWRLPTEHEVETMMENMYGDLILEGDSTRTWNSNQAIIYTSFANVFNWTYAYVKTGYPAKYDYRSYGLYLKDSGESLMSGVRYKNYPKVSQSHIRVYTTSLYEDYDNGTYNEEFKNGSYGVFLVSDGGFTIGSLALNSVSDVSVPFASALSFIGLFGFRRRQ